MTLALNEICDLDCVVSTSPLILDLPNPVRYARGADAVLRRALYAICDERRVALPLLALKGYRFTDAELMRIRVEWEGAVRNLDYVRGCAFPMTLSALGDLTIGGRVYLSDGRSLTLPLEVTTANGPAAILAGAST